MEMMQVNPTQILLAFIGLIVWFTRLEAKTESNKREIDKQDIVIAKLKEKHETLESELIKELGEVKQTLARIEGQLSK